MPMRLGEMVLVIRTQDYASRNLNRLSANLGKLSKTQQLQRRMQMQGIQAERLIGRRDTLQRDIDLMRKRVDLEDKLNQTMRNRRMVERGLSRMQAQTTAKGMLRGPGTSGFLGQAAPFVAQAKAGIAQLTKEEATLTAQLKVARKALLDQNATLGRMNTKKARAELAAMNRELALTSRRLKVAQADMAVTQQAINRLRWDNIHKGGMAFSRAGRVMQLSGLIAVGGLAAMGNRAAEFSASATLAATQARNLGDGVGYQAEVLSKSRRIQDAVLEQMQKYPTSAEEMTNATYEIFSSLDLMNNKGIVNVTKGLKILEIANKAAVAGGVSLDDSMKGLIITLNNFDPQLQDTTGTLDTMFDIVRFGNIHFSDLTNIMSKVAPAAKAVGLDLEDVAGALAQATRTLPAGTVSAGFSQLLATFSDRSFQEGLRIASKTRLGRVIDIEQAGKLKAPLEILRDILTIFPELGRGGLETKRFFKLVTGLGTKSLTGKDTVGREFTIQQRRVFEALVQNFASVEELQAAILANNGELEKSFQVMVRDPGVQWKIFLSQMQALVLLIGRLALPALLTLVSYIQRLVTWFRNLSPATQDLIVKVGVFGGALLLVGGIVISIIGSIASLIGSLGLLSKGMTPLLMVARVVGALAGVGAIALILKTAWTGDATAMEFLQGAMLGAAAGSMFGPGGAVIGGITVPVIMQFMKTRPKAPREKGFDEFQDLRGGNPSAWKAFGDLSLFNPMSDYWKNAGKSMGMSREQFDKQWNLLIQEAKGKPRTLAQVAAFMKVDPGIRTIFNKYKDDIKGIGKPAKSASQAIKDLMAGTKNKTLQKELDRILKTIPQLEGMFGNSKQAADEWATGLADAVKSATQSAEQSIDQAAANLTSIFEQFRQQNASAFGELFSGPFFQSETWSLAEEWDVKPSMKEINRDLKMQIADFKKWRNALKVIGKRKGATPELMKELSALGPGASSS